MVGACFLVCGRNPWHVKSLTKKPSKILRRHWQTAVELTLLASVRGCERCTYLSSALWRHSKVPAVRSPDVIPQHSNSDDIVAFRKARRRRARAAQDDTDSDSSVAAAPILDPLTRKASRTPTTRAQAKLRRRSPGCWQDPLSNASNLSSYPMACDSMI